MFIKSEKRIKFTIKNRERVAPEMGVTLLLRIGGSLSKPHQNQPRQNNWSLKRTSTFCGQGRTAFRVSALQKSNGH